LVAEGKISAGHARALLAVPNPEAVAQEVVDKGLNVRAVESLAQQSAAEQGRAPQRRPRTAAVATKDADTRALEKRVTDALGLKVTLDDRGGVGTLHIQYGSLEQLEDVLRRLEKA
jgi:ParB family chromosome partitioning protein